MIYRFLNDSKPPILKDHLNLGGKNKTESIQVNSRYLERNDECWIPVMGEIHYSRLSRSEWERELLKMKAGGITSVSTYVIWIYHEEKEGVFDFSGNRDLRAFAQTVRDCGLEMVLRIGPWVHGEVRNGGFPDWLLKKNCFLRTDDEKYLAFVERYWRQIYTQVADLLFENGGPIWAIQLENELTDRASHLLTLKKLAQKIGLCVPIYTVTGWNAAFGAQIPETEVLPVFGGYAEAPWAEHTHELEPSSHYFFLPDRNDSAIGADLLVHEQPDQTNTFHMQYDLYPFATCELGGGIQVTHHRRPIIQGDDVAALSLVALGCGNNLPGYYMYHGGTNAIGELSTLQESKASGYPNDLPIRSYDFQAPLGEYGQIRDQFAKLRLQHLFLHSFGRDFGKMDVFFAQTHPENRADRSSLRYAMRANSKQGFVFFNNYQRICEMPEKDDVQFEVRVNGEPMIFPEKPIRILPNTYGFFPFQMPLAGAVLNYATTQPLARKENTWFFVALPGIEPKYCIDGKLFGTTRSDVDVFTIGTDDSVCNIVTLSMEQALRCSMIENEIYLSDGVLTEKNGEFFLEWTGEQAKIEHWESNRFVDMAEMQSQKNEIGIQCVPMSNVTVYPKGAEEIALSGPVGCKMWQIMLSLPQEPETVCDVLLQIEYVGDLAQLYFNQSLVSDDYNKGTPWQISLKNVMDGRLKAGSVSLELLITENVGRPVYTENEAAKKKGADVLKIAPVFVYREQITRNVCDGLD